MIKGKGKNTTDDIKTGGIIHIERGDWDIDPETVTEVQELAPDEVMVITTGGSYRLTRDEAKPFLK